MKAKRLMDALGGIDEGYVEAAAPKKRRHIAPYLAVAACLVLLVGVLYFRQQRGQRMDSGVTMSAEGVVIPKMQITLPGFGTAADMIGFFIYGGRSYVHYMYLENADHLVGEYLGTATGGIDEWATPDEYIEFSGSARGDFYAVNGFDPGFMLCIERENGMVEIFINDNDLTLKYGAEVFEDRLHLSGNITAVTVQTRADWYHSTGVEYALDASELTDFLRALNEGTFLPRMSMPLPEGVTSPFDSLERYHLFLAMENGMIVQLRLWEGGYVYFDGLTHVCVQLDQEVFDALLTRLNEICR